VKEPARALLLDTHAAIWLVEGQLSTDAVEKLVYAGLADGVYVSPVSAWEVGLLARPKTGLQFLPDPVSWFSSLMGKAVMKSAPLTPSIAINASFLPGTFHNDPADRLLVATAREMNIALMTRDKGILAYGDEGHVKTEAC
jgi:PIN domain nuclease of toxin-antitoxin system